MNSSVLAGMFGTKDLHQMLTLRQNPSALPTDIDSGQLGSCGPRKIWLRDLGRRVALTGISRRPWLSSQGHTVTLFRAVTFLWGWCPPMMGHRVGKTLRGRSVPKTTDGPLHLPFTLVSACYRCLGAGAGLGGPGVFGAAAGVYGAGRAPGRKAFALQH